MWFSVITGTVVAILLKYMGVESFSMEWWVGVVVLNALPPTAVLIEQLSTIRTKYWENDYD